MGLDRMRRDRQLASDLRHGEVGGQVTRHTQFALAQRVSQRPRPDTGRSRCLAGQLGEQVTGGGFPPVQVQAVTARTSAAAGTVARSAPSTDSQNRCGSRSSGPAATHAARPARPAALIQDRSNTVLPLPAGADTTVTLAAPVRRPISPGRATTPPAPGATPRRETDPGPPDPPPDSTFRIISLVPEPSPGLAARLTRDSKANRAPVPVLRQDLDLLSRGARAFRPPRPAISPYRARPAGGSVAMGGETK
jgi:hypothetical protein